MDVIALEKVMKGKIISNEESEGEETPFATKPRLSEDHTMLGKLESPIRMK